MIGLASIARTNCARNQSADCNHPNGGVKSWQKKTVPRSARFRTDQFLRLTWRYWSAQFRQTAPIAAGELVAVVEISRHADGECHYHVRSEDGRECWADEESLELPLIPQEE